MRDDLAGVFPLQVSPCATCMIPASGRPWVMPIIRRHHRSHPRLGVLQDLGSAQQNLIQVFLEALRTLPGTRH